MAVKKEAVGKKNDAFAAPFAELLAPLAKFARDERAKLVPIDEKIVKVEDEIHAKKARIYKANEVLRENKMRLNSEDPSERITGKQLAKVKQTTDDESAKLKSQVSELNAQLPILKKEYAQILKAAIAQLNHEFGPTYLQLVKEKVNDGKAAKNKAAALANKDVLLRAKNQKFILLEQLTGSKLTLCQRLVRSVTTAFSHWSIHILRHAVAKANAMEHALLTDEQKSSLLFPLYEPVKDIQSQIDVLRADGEDRVNALKAEIRKIRSSKDLDKKTRTTLLETDKAQMRHAKLLAKRRSDEIATLIQKAELFLQEYYNADYYTFINVNVAKRRKIEKVEYRTNLAAAKAERKKVLSKLNGLSDETYEEKKAKKTKLSSSKLAYKNELSELKITHKKTIQALKDEKHAAFIYKYHLIDLLRNSRFTPSQSLAQKFEMYGYSFKFANFLLKYGLYIVIICVFIFLCIWAPTSGKGDLLTARNVFEILSQSSPRTFFALGVAGLILLAGTDLSVGRMVSLGAIATSMIFHPGPNTITLFGQAGINFSGLPDGVRILLALVISVGLCVLFSSLAGFFSAKFKMHPFITTLSTQLIIFGLVYYGTNGLGSGAIDSGIRNSLTPELGMFPSVILWALACIFIVWLIWNKTKFGKYMYAVGGNPEAASVSGISVFAVTLGVFVMAGVLYGLGGFLEANRVNGSASAVTGQGWELDAIAACVVGGISFSGGIGKISGAVAGVVIFQALTYALSFMGIDTNLQFIFKGVIIMAAVAMDSVKYLKRK